MPNLTPEDMMVAIPVGIVVGIISLVIGSVIMGVTSTGSFTELGSLVVPAMGTVAALGTASVIPVSLLTAANIFGQWVYVAPGEEAGFRVLTVYGLQTVFNNPIFAFFGATLIWALLHLPVWMTTGVSSVMYVVVIVWGVIWSAQFVIMRNYFSNVISHAVTNTGVILTTSMGMTGLDTYTVGVLVAISIVLIALAWYYKGSGSRA